MPTEAKQFVKKLRTNALKELDQIQPLGHEGLGQTTGALMSSLHTVSSMSAGVCNYNYLLISSVLKCFYFSSPFAV